jgi:hypothetical protein
MSSNCVVWLRIHPGSFEEYQLRGKILARVATLHKGISGKGDSPAQPSGDGTIAYP